MPVLLSFSDEIFIGDDVSRWLEKFLSEKYSGRKLFILVDRNTKTQCLPQIVAGVSAFSNATIFEIPDGERTKSISTCEKLWDELTQHGADRRSVLINLGGGIVCDVGGFVASTYMRGIDFINIPTTLLAVVDASMGGKNGINFSGLKNQVGTFAKPSAVFISDSFLKTLPERELKSGFAEIIKHVLIADSEKWNELKSLESLAGINWIELISDSVYIKNKIVHADFKDFNGRRTLNFGHTLGHAFESYSLHQDADPLKHGEAIAIGMIGEIYLSQKMLHFPEQHAHEIISFIQKHFQFLSPEINVDEILALIRADKKNEQSTMNFVLLRMIGEPVINQNPGEALIREAIEFTIQQLRLSVDHH